MGEFQLSAAEDMADGQGTKGAPCSGMCFTYALSVCLLDSCIPIAHSGKADPIEFKTCKRGFEINQK